VAPNVTPEDCACFAVVTTYYLQLSQISEVGSASDCAHSQLKSAREAELQTLLFGTHPMYLAVSSPEWVAVLRRAFMQRFEDCKTPMRQHNVGELLSICSVQAAVFKGHSQSRHALADGQILHAAETPPTFKIIFCLLSCCEGASNMASAHMEQVQPLCHVCFPASYPLHRHTFWRSITSSS
jgi:hypothetical protein